MIDFFKHENSEDEDAKKKAAEEQDDASEDEAAAETSEGDAYMAALWSYNPKAPEMGMRDAKELEQLFYENEFHFTKGAYQPGELAFMAAFSERLIQKLMEGRAEEVKRQKTLKEKTEEDRLKLKQLEELLQVTINRRRVVLQDLAPWVRDLERIRYFRSSFTGQPYIDAKGRVFLFTEKEAVKRAAERAETLPDAELAEASPEALNQALYLNGCEVTVYNDGVISYTAGRKELFGPAPAEDVPEGEAVPDPNRILRYFVLGFLQLVRSPQEGNPENKQKILTQFEAQMAPRLLQAKMYFAVKEERDDQMLFTLLTDGQGHEAVACYTDPYSIPEDRSFKLKELSFYFVAAKLAEEEGEPNGILINPGELNFFMDKNWLRRLAGFGRYIQKKAAEKKQKGENSTSEEHAPSDPEAGK